MERLGCKYLKRVLGICVRRGIINMRLVIIEFIVWLSERLQPRLIGDFHFTSFLFCYYLIKSLITIMSSLLTRIDEVNRDGFNFVFLVVLNLDHTFSFSCCAIWHHVTFICSNPICSKAHCTPRHPMESLVAVLSYIFL